jgi:hypothetical protein
MDGADSIMAGVENRESVGRTIPDGGKQAPADGPPQSWRSVAKAIGRSSRWPGGLRQESTMTLTWIARRKWGVAGALANQLRNAPKKQ